MPQVCDICGEAFPVTNGSYYITWGRLQVCSDCNERYRIQRHVVYSGSSSTFFHITRENDEIKLEQEDL
jgi:ribosome-binding protein aMBF1 (putative translation factor)